MLKTKFVLIIILLIICLILRFYFFFQSQPRYYDGQQIRFETTVTEEPLVRNGWQHFYVKTPTGSRVRIVAPVNHFLGYGDRLFIDGIFTRSDYGLAMYHPKFQIVNKDQNIITKSRLYIKNKTKTLFETMLSPIGSSLMLGILFGGKHDMPDNFLEKLRTIGAIHIIAASGMNVSFITGAFMAMFGTIFKRQIAIGLSIFGILFYVFLAGFEPSIVRASIMAILALSCSLLGRQYTALLILFITGYIMLFLDPGLLSDIGFELSFLATFGILLIKPLLPLGKQTIFTEDFGTTLAAQIGTLPIVLGTFGTYGFLSIFVNVLILWTVPVLMLFGSVGLLLGLVFEPLGKLVIYLCLPFLLYFEYIVSLFGGVGWMLEIEHFPWQFTVGYYLLLLAFILLKKPATQTPQKLELGL